MNRKVLLAIVTGCTLLGITTFAFAAMSEVTGTLDGLSCAQQMKDCPVDGMDPHLALETGFVVKMDGGKHLLITGVDRSVTARHVHEKVMVKGTVNDKYSTINASAIMVNKGGKWVEIWSRKAEDEERMKMYLP